MRFCVSRISPSFSCLVSLPRSHVSYVQHEIDHLDGILALDRAVDASSIVAREVYERNRNEFDAQVDYFIVPTINKEA